MNKINEMIREMCPDGVEYKLLQELGTITIGEFVRKDLQSNEYAYPVYNGGTSNTGFYKASNQPANKIVISARGNAGFTNRVKEPFWAGNSCYVIDVGERADWNFVYYYLKHYEPELMAQQTIGTIPAVSKKQVSMIPVPVPPLPIQREIVRVLDSFMDYTAELQAELRARKKQYAYYRDSLLDFENGLGKKIWSGEVEYKHLGDVFNTRNGFTPSTKNEAFWGGDIPWYRMEDLRANGHVLSNSIQHIMPEAVKGKLFPANTIIMATTATIGEHALLTKPSLCNQRFTAFWPKNDFVSGIDPRYAYHYFYIIDKWCKNHTRIGKLPSVDMVALRNYVFGLPPLSVQHQIVEILDKFESLTNDLTTGLPAEIDLRQKQYEYYRDTLLDFKMIS